MLQQNKIGSRGEQIGVCWRTGYISAISNHTFSMLKLHECVHVSPVLVVHTPYLEQLFYNLSLTQSHESPDPTEWKWVSRVSGSDSVASTSRPLPFLLLH